MRFMQTESVLQTKNRSGPAKNRFSVALVQTQIRIRIYTVCHSVCIFWTHYSVVKQHCSNFSVTTAIFSSVRFFTVLHVH